MQQKMKRLHTKVMEQSMVMMPAVVMVVEVVFVGGQE